VKNKISAMFANKKSCYYLYLMDDISGEPVLPPDGDGCFPIEISVTSVSNQVKSLLPLMKKSLKFACVLNKGLGVAQLFFPGVPKIPEEYLAKAQKLTSTLKDGNSMASDHALIGASVDDATNGGPQVTSEARGAALRDLQGLILEHDPKKKFCGLRRISTKSGRAVWTL
jgi:hypothetical protein